VPKPVKITFCSFLDIKDPTIYAAPNQSLLLQAGHSASLNPNFNLTEWWRIAKGKKLSGPFNVSDELVTGAASPREGKCIFYKLHMPHSQPGLQRLSSAELCARTINNFKEASRLHHKIKNWVKSVKSLITQSSGACAIEQQS